jgi:hypothetical protein
VTLAQTARAGYSGTSPRVAAILDLWAAEAHAADHANTDCRRALDAAFDRTGDIGSCHSDPGWSYWLNETAAHSFAGHCYLHLRDWGRARSHLCSALRLQDASFAREGALRRLRLATTYLRQERPELDQALSLGTHAIETLTGTVRSALGIADLTRVVDGLAPYRRRPAVREFIDRAAELKRRAA